MEKRFTLIITLLIGLFSAQSYSQNVDYSVLSVPEESGIDFTQISTVSDYVCMPIVKRSSKNISWLTNRILSVSPDGGKIAYLSARNKSTNIFIKEISRQGASTQRTNRSKVLDFSYSPDGKTLAFCEDRGSGYQVFLTDANSGFVCRQITSGNNDYSPTFSTDMEYIYFARQENSGVSIWSFCTKNNLLASYTIGMNPYPIKGEKNTPHILCTRQNANGDSEIWDIDFISGVEKCIVSERGKSFTTPMLSPNGKWILCAGSSYIQVANKVFRNVDIYVARADGSKIMQLTFHAADDLSPVWSTDGKSIFFISQRGSQNGDANIWRMSFNEAKMY